MQPDFSIILNIYRVNIDFLAIKSVSIAADSTKL